MDYPVVKIKDNGLKMWWSGDKRVEPYMYEVNKAINNSGIKGQDRITVYNKCYEAVYNAIIERSGK